MRGTGPKVGRSTGRQRESLLNVASKTPAREGGVYFQPQPIPPYQPGGEMTKRPRIVGPTGMITGRSDPPGGGGSSNNLWRDLPIGLRTPEWTPRTLYGMQQLLAQKWGKREEPVRPPVDRLRDVRPGVQPPSPDRPWPGGVPTKPPLDQETLTRMLRMLAVGGGLAGLASGANLARGAVSGLPAILPPSDVWMPEYMRGQTRATQA